MKISLEVIDTKFNGVVLYSGPSLLNGKPIIVIATGLRTRSKNGKTGEFIQTYILSAEKDRPTDALDSGKDESVCGDCINRKVDGWGTCYVNVGQGPNAIYSAWKRGVYPEFRDEHLELFKDRIVRLGAYGDPAAVPVSVWEKICGVAEGWTGYTHQWRRKSAQSYKKFCMASVETARQMRRAKSMGWKTFRVRIKGEAVLPGEFVCPASEEAGKRKTCETCLADKWSVETKGGRKFLVIPSETNYDEFVNSFVEKAIKDAPYRDPEEVRRFVEARVPRESTVKVDPLSFPPSGGGSGSSPATRCGVARSRKRRPTSVLR
jgi:hypothetical protein